MTRNWFVGLALAASVSSLGAQTGEISGSVSRGGLPVADVRVILDGARQTRTDSAGEFAFDEVSAGRHRLQVTAIGASPVSVDLKVVEGETTPVTVALEQQLVHLDTIRVDAITSKTETVRAFEDRKRLGLGKFLDSTQMRPFQETIQAAADAGPGVKINRGALTFGYPGCYPEIWIDGTDWGTDQGILRTTHPRDIAAMEVYLRNVPVQFRSRKNTCGALLIWTRRAWEG